MRIIHPDGLCYRREKFRKTGDPYPYSIGCQEPERRSVNSERGMASSKSGQ